MGEALVVVTAIPSRPWAQIRYAFPDGHIETSPMVDGHATTMPAHCALLAIESIRPIYQLPETTITFSRLDS